MQNLIHNLLAKQSHRCDTDNLEITQQEDSHTGTEKKTTVPEIFPFRKVMFYENLIFEMGGLFNM